MEVELQVGAGRETQGVPVGKEVRFFRRLGGLLERLAQTGKGAPQSRPTMRLVASGPQEFDYLAPAAPTTLGGEVGQEGQCLAGTESYGPLAVSDLWRAEKFQAQLFHLTSQ